MREFFVAQMDYVFLVYGLAFIVLALAAFFIFRAKPAKVLWKWIALFGLIHGIAEWLDMLALSLGNSVPLNTLRMTFLTSSFLCFVEVIRLGARKRWGKIFGVWFYGPLLFITLGFGWILGGFDGANILSRYVFGVLGGFMVAGILLESSAVQEKEIKSRTLPVFAWLLGVYSATQFFPPKGTFLPASMINQEMFLSFAGFPVQLLRMFLATALAGLVWEEYALQRRKMAMGTETKNQFRKEFWFPLGLAVVLFIGWIASGVFGQDRAVEESNDRLNRVKVAAAMIDPDDIRALSGTSADVQNSHYQHILGQFLNILQDAPDTIYVYLFGQKNGKNIFLVDSELSSRKSFSEPLATPGEVYKEDVELLRRMFVFGGALTVGPETDKWGTFISSLVAIRDPLDGKIISVLGFDYDAKAWAMMIARNRLNPILITLLFVILLIVFFVIFQREQEVRRDAQAGERVLKRLMLRLKNKRDHLALEVEDRKLLEKVSLENAEFLQKLMDSIPIPVFYKDISGVYIGCNKAFEAFFGISQKQLMGKKVEEIFPLEIARIYQEKDAELLALPGVQVYEASMKNTEGESRSLVFHKATFAGPSGEVQGIIGVIMDFTLRKQAEEARKASQNFLNAAIDSISDIFYVCDAEGQLILWNAGLEKVTGYLPEEIARMKATDFFDEQAAIRIREAIKLAFEKGFNTVEENILTKDGRKIPILFSGTVSQDITGRSILCGIGKDITERKRMEALLGESEKRFLDILYASQDAILLIDGDTFVDCNESAARMLGYATREECLRKHPSELSPPLQPDGKPSFDKANEMMRLAYEKGFHRFEWVHQKANGENFPVEVSLTPVAVHGKNILHCHWRDIAELKQIETRLQQLSQAIEQSPSCAVITDREGKIEYVNQRFVELTGYSREEALGQNPRILKSGEQSPEFYKDLWGTIRSGKDWQGQFCNKKKNGELYWELAHIAPLRDENGVITHFVAVKEDITYRRQIEEQLRHSLRMEAVGRLAGGIAHDFNNMLTVINGYSGYVLGKMKTEDPYYEKIREIRDAGDCAATIVRQLLNLSRKEAVKPQLVRVSDATGKMKHILNRLLGDSIELNLEHAEEAGFVKMDPGQLEQIFLNLIVNAREAMPEGGILTVTTEHVRMEEIHEEMIPSKKKTGDFVRITVKDTGLGIDPALRARIFEPFFTTKKRGMNTGLGLSIIRGIVEQSGGAISLESHVGKGTIFRVYLPQAEVYGKIPGKVLLEDLPPGKGKILLVEDETQVREFALQVLRERGYDVRVARGGNEALKMLEEDPGRKYDLVLTDLTMPKMNGKELVTRIREKVPALKVIFMSGYSEQAVLDVERSDFLQKPFSHRALVMKVWDVLGR